MTLARRYIRKCYLEFVLKHPAFSFLFAGFVSPIAYQLVLLVGARGRKSSDERVQRICVHPRSANSVSGTHVQDHWTATSFIQILS